MHLTLALLLFSGSPSPRAAAAGDAGAAPVRGVTSPVGAVAPRPDDGIGSITVDLAGLEPLDPTMRAELARLLQTRAAAVVERLEGPTSAVRIAIGWHDVERVDYAVVIELGGHADDDACRDRRATGPDTEQSELADVVEAALDRLLVDHAREHRAPVSTPSAAVSPSQDRPSSTPRALGPMGWAGVGTAIAGVCSLGVGVGLLTLEPTVSPRDETKLRTWEPGGIAFTAVGGAAIVTGVVLASLDGRRRAHARRVSVAPWARRRSAGLHLGFRF
jgi:hypothetical protein